jgi:hypothetical protein
MGSEIPQAGKKAPGPAHASRSNIDVPVIPLLPSFRAWPANTGIAWPKHGRFIYGDRAD